MELPFVKALQITAMEAVTEPDWEAIYRRICRWYSKTFSTPLMEVFDLPVSWVLMNYYEHAYEQMDEEEKLRTWEDLTETPEERAKREAEEAAEMKANTADISDHVERIRKKMAASAGQLEKATDRLSKLSKPQTKAKDLDEIRKTLLEANNKAAPAPQSPAEMPAALPEFEFSIGGEPIDFDEDVLARGLPKPKG